MENEVEGESGSSARPVLPSTCVTRSITIKDPIRVDHYSLERWRDAKICMQIKNYKIIVVDRESSEDKWKFVSKMISRLIDPELGYCYRFNENDSYKAYLCLDKTNRFVGFLLAEPQTTAVKVITDPITNLAYMSKERYPVRCGISRLWTHENYRRKKIATCLVNAMLNNFYEKEILNLGEISMSYFTNDGKAFAIMYFGRSDIFIYPI